MHYNQSCSFDFQKCKRTETRVAFRKFKRFTSKEIIKSIIDNPRENRKERLLELFKKGGRESSNVNKYQFWRHDNKPIELWSNKVIDEKINYIHNNPVEEGLVYKQLGHKIQSCDSEASYERLNHYYKELRYKKVK